MRDQLRVSKEVRRGDRGSIGACLGQVINMTKHVHMLTTCDEKLPMKIIISTIFSVSPAFQKCLWPRCNAWQSIKLGLVARGDRQGKAPCDGTFRN